MRRPCCGCDPQNPTGTKGTSAGCDLAPDNPPRNRTFTVDVANKPAK